jgi:hypothetical protein
MPDLQNPWKSPHSPPLFSSHLPCCRVSCRYETAFVVVYCFAVTAVDLTTLRYVTHPNWDGFCGSGLLLLHPFLWFCTVFFGTLLNITNTRRIDAHMSRGVVVVRTEAEAKCVQCSAATVNTQCHHDGQKDHFGFT